MKSGEWRIEYIEKIDSTQKYLLEKIEKENLNYYCVWSDYQTNGIGSRGNRWIGKRGNLFFSFCVSLEEFSFVPIQSLSIYFGFLMKKTLNSLGSKVVLKWPNDLYLKRKVGGILTNVKNKKVVCGIGINTKFEIDGFDRLDIEMKNDTILQEFFKLLKLKPNWDEIIKEYKKEFNLTKNRFLIEGELADDGSIMKNSQRIYSKR